MTPTQRQISTHLANLKPQFDFPLADKTYFKIGGPAEVYIEVEKKSQLVGLVQFCLEHKIKLTVIGGASNLLIADRGIRGVVVKIIADQFEDLGDGLVKAQTGIKMATLVKKTIDLGLTGLEFFLGVPGTLGGAIYNNAHYLDKLIDQYIHSVEVINKNGEFLTLSHQDCQFSYDHSRFQSTGEIIFEVTFKLHKGDQKHSMSLVKKATEYRAKTQPLGEPSSGCIFQNVPNSDHLRQLFPQFKDRSHVPGGFLIDQAGLKNQHIGDIYVSDIHAAFLVNRGKGTAEDVLKMIELIKKTVKDKFNTNLKEEIFYLK